MQIGHPVKSGGFIDFSITFDAGKFGGTALSISLLNSKEGHGARDVRNCHVIGVGPVADTATSLLTNYSELVDAVNLSSLFLLIGSVLLTLFRR